MTKTRQKIDVKLNPKQSIAVQYLDPSNTTVNKVLFGGAAGGGKSWIGCLWVLLNCLNYPGTRWCIGRSKLKTLKETTLVTMFKVMKMLGMQSGVDYIYNDNKSQIYIIDTESVIILKDLFLYPSDPEFTSLGSLEITGAFVDEAAEITEKAIDILFSRIRHLNDVYELPPKLLMTCNPHKGWLYINYYKPWKDKSLPEDKVFIQALIKDNRDNLPKYYEEQLKQLDPISRARLLDGNWEYDLDDTKLFAYDNVINTFLNDAIEDTGKRYISADVARFGADKAVVIVWNGLRAETIKVYPKCDTQELAEKIKTLARNNNVPMSRVIVDDDGVGGGVVDALKCRGFINNSKAITRKTSKQLSTDKEKKRRYKDNNYVNLKTQCYFKLAEKIENGEIYINSPDHVIKNDIVEELEVIKRKNPDSDGPLAIITKDEMKKILGRSPDYADALMMRMYFELVPKFDLREVKLGKKRYNYENIPL